MKPKPKPSANERRLWAAAILILVLGLAIQLFLWSRQWVEEDQLVFLARGFDWVQGGGLAPFAAPMSGGGRNLGSLLQLMVGLPLAIWPDYRSPTLLMGLTQLAAAVVLGLTLRAAAGTSFAVVYLALFWLSPWRIYHSGFLWNPSFLFFPAALHLAASYRLRERPRFAASAVLAATPILAWQLHPSFLVLLLAIPILLWRKTVKLNYWGAAVGVAAASLTLIPTLLAALRGELPRVTPGWVTDLPPVIGNAFKGFIYWFRLGSLDVGRRLRHTVPNLEADLAGSPWQPIAHVLFLALIAIAMLSIAVAVLASWQYLRRPRRNEAENGVSQEATSTAGREWIRQYALALFFAMLVATAISPVTIQAWHVLIALHAACLPVAVWLQDSLSGKSSVRRAVAIGFLVLAPVVGLVSSLGSSMYRRPSDTQVMEETIPAELRPLFRSHLPEGGQSGANGL